MNEIKRTEVEINQEELFKNILLICPKCKIKKNLNIPSKIINQSKHITTISIPTKTICEHSFQVFVDKNFEVRGYQKVDFEFPRMEFYESSIEALEGEQKEEDSLSTLSSLPLFQDIINLLRGCVDNKQILGSALLTIEGKVLYSSLPYNALLNTIKEFEVRIEKKLIGFIKMYIELKNHQKVCAEYLEIHSIDFILILIFSNQVMFGMGNLLLRDLTKKMKELT